MARIKHSVSTHRRKKRLLKKAKGFFLDRSKRYQQARRTLMKGMVYAYRDRKVKKREFRALWIARINAACRQSEINYSRFIRGLTQAGVLINRQALSELAIKSPEAFSELVKLAKQNLPVKATKTASQALL